MKKLVMAVVAALAVACAMADEPQRGPRRHRGERNGERRANFDRPMPPPMMMHGSSGMILRMLSSKMGLERIGVTDEAEGKKIVEALRPIREESDTLESKIRELIRAQAQSLRELLKDKAADPKAAKEKVGEIEKLRAEQGSLVIKAILVLRENLTAEQADKASELFSGRGMMRPGGMGAGGERHRSRRNGGEGRRGSSAPADKPAADK